MESATTVAIACDHAAWQLKDLLITSPLLKSYTWIDYGTSGEEGHVDYPDYAQAVVRALQAKEVDWGICLCGTGIGMSMVANRFADIRAALAWNMATIKSSRKHNNANILCLGARVLEHSKVPELVRVWLTTDFDQGRHLKRLHKFPQPG